MKVEIENTRGHFKKLTIEVPADSVATHSLEHYKRIQREVELKGFRKGKAPLDLVRTAYADSAAPRITRELVELHFGNAVREHKLNPVSTPDIEILNFSELSGMKFTATFENTPPVELKDYTGFKGDAFTGEVTADEVETTVKNVAGQMATLEPLPADAVIADGVVVDLDYEATEGGQPFPQASDKDASFEIGTGNLIADFEKNILGAKAGEERKFTVTFPAAASEAEATPVSGKTLDFTVQVKGLKKKILPELNDDFAKKIGPFEGIAALRTRIQDDLLNEKQQRHKRDNMEKAVTWLIEQNPVDAPETMVTHQLEQLAVDAGMQLQQMGLDEKSIEERLKNWGPEMQERAVRQVKASLLLSNVAEKENIKASEEEIRDEINKLAMQSRKNPQQVLEDLRERGLLYGLIRQITELKALNFVAERT
jgi:trigger factor